MVRASGDPYRRAMTGSRKRSVPRHGGDPRSLPLQLPPDGAFVLHLDARALPPRRMLGRVEHVVSGRVAHITSLGGLVAFLTDVLCDEAPRTEASGLSNTIGRRPER
jgi:hypothetical protein